MTLKELRAALKDHPPGSILAVQVGPDQVEAMKSLPNVLLAPYRTMEARPGELGCVEMFRFYESTAGGWSVSGVE